MSVGCCLPAVAPRPTVKPGLFFSGNPMTIVQDPDRKRALVLRLKRIEGQLRGIQRLLEEDEDCEKVAQQLAAARKALDKSFYTLVGCVISQGDVPADDVAEMLAKFA
jgi:DNA-binding FrmR family transcriptional regulator